ncbi:MAG: class I SAM-dependent methyltransferase [Deltaproteobacteria bacterium]|nr:class I SAM-dependent methyltransferase [Deltaproteobacteria bacterium]
MFLQFDLLTMERSEKVINYFSSYVGDNDYLNNLVRIHFNLMLKWQKIGNLIGLSDDRDIAEFLYLDSFIALKHVSEFLLTQGIEVSDISDIGSGAGFPSIFWVHFLPDVRVSFFEPKRKRANFLREFIRTADLKNYIVKEEMVKKESLKTQLVISKAAININDWPRFGLSNLSRRGILVSMLTSESEIIYHRAIQKVGRILRSEIIRYTLPYSSKPRALGIIQKK